MTNPFFLYMARDGIADRIGQSHGVPYLVGFDAIKKMRGERFSFADCAIMNCVNTGAFLAFDRSIEGATRYSDRLFKLVCKLLPADDLCQWQSDIRRARKKLDWMRRLELKEGLDSAVSDFEQSVKQRAIN